MSDKLQRKGPSIQTTGEMREFLVLSMLGVKNGDIPIDRAEQIQKFAGHINDSLYSEAKLAAFISQAGGLAPALGNLQLGASDLATPPALPPKK